MGLDPLPVHMRPPEPDPLPLRVDVINGWPLTNYSVELSKNKNILILLLNTDKTAIKHYLV